MANHRHSFASAVPGDYLLSVDLHPGILARGQQSIDSCHAYRGLHWAARPGQAGHLSGAALCQPTGVAYRRLTVVVIGTARQRRSQTTPLDPRNFDYDCCPESAYSNLPQESIR
ncbi:MAG: hypothetical protein Kow0063_24620 [Anaerolineae bacterium]